MNALATDHRNAEVAALVAAGVRRDALADRFGVSVVRIGEITRREEALRPGSGKANAALLEPCARAHCPNLYLPRGNRVRRLYCARPCATRAAIAAWGRRKAARARNFEPGRRVVLDPMNADVPLTYAE